MHSTRTIKTDDIVDRTAINTLPPPTDLRVEGLESYAAVLSLALPHFSFVHADSLNAVRGLGQVAYRLTVSVDKTTGRKHTTFE